MNDLAIRIDNIGKLYRVGGERERYKTLRDSIQRTIVTSFHRMVTHDTKPDTSNLFWALRHITFDIHKGEVVGVIGRNGAGKTTILKVLSRITEPTEGCALTYGRVGSLLEVGTGFHAELTGRENIYLNGAILGMRRQEIDRKFDEIVDFADINQFLDTPVKRYSSGMYVRLAFAVAAHMDTDILLVDEILSVGDMGFQKKSQKKMKELTGSGRTILFVTHNMALVNAMCTRAILLESGSLKLDSDPQTAVAKYLSSDQAGPLCRNIAESDHAFGIAKVRVIRISIIDENENVLDSVLYHQPIRVRVELNVQSYISAGTFSISVLSSEGVRIFITHSLDRDGQYSEFKPGAYVVTVKLDNHLHPGEYSIEFGGHQLPTTLSLCHIPEAIRFRVLDMGNSDQDRFNYHNRMGLVDVISQWEIGRN